MTRPFLIQPLQQQSVEDEVEKQQKNNIAKVMMMRIDAATSQSLVLGTSACAKKTVPIPWPPTCCYQVINLTFANPAAGVVLEEAQPLSSSC
eukprot:scaffold12822_cov88-Cylindrotheca_fusiformis.AAC.1